MAYIYQTYWGNTVAIPPPLLFNEMIQLRRAITRVNQAVQVRDLAQMFVGTFCTRHGHTRGRGSESLIGFLDPVCQQSRKVDISNVELAV